MRCARWVSLLAATFAAVLAGPVHAASAASCGPPVTVSPTSIQVGEFTSLGVSHGSGTLTATVRWGDGGLQAHTFAPDTSFTFTHVYVVPGAYRVTMDDRGVDGSGTVCSDSAQLQGVVTVAARPGAPAPASVPCWTKPTFSLAGRTGRVGTPFVWTISAANWPSLTESVSWGDGTAPDTASLLRGQVHRWSHAYARPGSYEIRRHVSGTFTNGRACQHDESLGTITILGSPGAGCLFDAPAATVPNVSIGQVAWAYRLADGRTWRFGSTDGLGSSWSQAAPWEVMWRVLVARSPAFQWYRCANVASTSPAAADGAVGAQFATTSLSLTDNNLTKALAILRAYGAGLPAPADAGRVNDYFNGALPGFGARRVARPVVHPLVPASSGPTCALAVSRTSFWHHQVAVRHRAIRRARTPQARRRARGAYVRAQRSWRTWRGRKRSAC